MSSSIIADQAQTPGADTEHRPRAELAQPCFDGARPLEPYLVHVATLYNDWDRCMAATHLALALEGAALRIFASQLLEQCRDMEKLIAALRWRFDQMEPKVVS